MTRTIDHDPDFAIYAGICHGCDALVKVNEIGMCEDCAAKLDRDLIRKRDWDYSVFAFGCPVDKREELRENIIARLVHARQHRFRAFGGHSQVALDRRRTDDVGMGIAGLA